MEFEETCLSYTVVIATATSCDRALHISARFKPFVPPQRNTARHRAVMHARVWIFAPALPRQLASSFLVYGAVS